MANASGRYFLDGIDMYSAYGYIPSSGSDDMLKIGTVKPLLSKNWGDENGTEYDLTSPRKVEDKTIGLKGWLVAYNEADFWAKYNALVSVLLQSGTKTLQYTEFGINKTVTVFYKECSELKRRTPLKADVIGMQLDLVFQEVIVAPIVGPAIYYGYSLTVPTTGAHVLALPLSVVPSLTPLTLPTGTNRIFAAAFPAGYLLSTAYNQTAQEDVTTEFVPVTIDVNGAPYKVYIMQMAVAYDLTQNILLTPING